MYKKFPIVLFFLLVFFNQQIVTEDSDLDTNSTYLACEQGKIGTFVGRQFKPGKFSINDLLLDKIKLKLSKKIEKRIIKEAQGKIPYIKTYPELNFIFLVLDKTKTEMCREDLQFMAGANKSTYQQKDGCIEIDTYPEKYRWNHTNSGSWGYEKWERELNRDNMHYFEYYLREYNDGEVYTTISELENYQCKFSNLEEFELIKMKLKDLEEPFRKISDAEKERLRLIEEEKASKRKI